MRVRPSLPVFVLHLPLLVGKEEALARAMELAGQAGPTLTPATIATLAQEVVAMSQVGRPNLSTLLALLLTLIQVIADQIEKLPGAHLTEDEQLATLAKLNAENSALGEEIVATVALAERLHEDVCAALERLSRDRLADQLQHTPCETLHTHTT